MYVVLSIKPQYAKKIYSGEKTWEFRKVVPIEFVHRFLLYETSPVRRITGWFDTKYPYIEKCPYIRADELTEPEIYQFVEDKADTVHRHQIVRYARGARILYGIPIVKKGRLKYPLDPITEGWWNYPPHTFFYFPGAWVKDTKELKELGDNYAWDE